MGKPEATPIFQDRKIECVDCGKLFTFGAGEQAFFYSKELSEPKRCQACRDRRKRTILPREMRNG